MNGEARQTAAPHLRRRSRTEAPNTFEQTLMGPKVLLVSFAGAARGFVR